MRRFTKYGNIPTRSKHTGRLFQSKKEANREPVLLALQNVGEISALSYQVPFTLEVYNTQAVEALLEALDPSTFSPASIQGLARELGRSKHRICKYVSDYSYLDKNGQLVVEDIKSPATRTPIYQLKKRLMLACQGIEIQEPEPGGVQQRARGAGIKGKGTGSRLKGGG